MKTTVKLTIKEFQVYEREVRIWAENAAKPYIDHWVLLLNRFPETEEKQELEKMGLLKARPIDFSDFPKFEETPEISEKEWEAQKEQISRLKEDLERTESERHRALTELHGLLLKIRLAKGSEKGEDNDN